MLIYLKMQMTILPMTPFKMHAFTHKLFVEPEKRLDLPLERHRGLRTSICNTEIVRLILDKRSDCNMCLFICVQTFFCRKNARIERIASISNFSKFTRRQICYRASGLFRKKAKEHIAQGFRKKPHTLAVSAFVIRRTSRPFANTMNVGTDRTSHSPAVRGLRPTSHTNIRNPAAVAAVCSAPASIRLHGIHHDALNHTTHVPDSRAASNAS